MCGWINLNIEKKRKMPDHNVTWLEAKKRMENVMFIVDGVHVYAVWFENEYT